MSEAFDHHDTDDIICPYCGKAQEAWGEELLSVGAYECRSCDEKFMYYRDVYVSFSTEKIEE